MEYNKIGLWAKGYLDALMTGEKVSKQQLEALIKKIREMIDENETAEEFRPGTSGSATDDLPF